MIVAFDPGGTTGWAYWHEETDEWGQGQIGPDEHHEELWDWLDSYAPDIVIYEAFNYQIRRDEKGTAVDMPGVELISREYIGIIRLWSQLNHCLDATKQQPSIITLKWLLDDRLKEMTYPRNNDQCLYRTNAPHANDATRHLLYYRAMVLKDKSIFKRS